jgi:hypothetical protein
MFVPYIKVLWHNSFEETEENHENLHLDNR